MDRDGMASRNVARRVLDVPEILSAVLSHNNQKGIARIACEFVEDGITPRCCAVWTEVTHLEPILRVLAPLERRGSGLTLSTTEGDLVRGISHSWQFTL